MNQLSRSRKITLFGTLGVMAASVLVRYGAVGNQGSVVASHDSIPVARQRLCRRLRFRLIWVRPSIRCRRLSARRHVLRTWDPKSSITTVAA